MRNIGKEYIQSLELSVDVENSAIAALLCARIYGQLLDQASVEFTDYVTDKNEFPEDIQGELIKAYSHLLLTANVHDRMKALAELFDHTSALAVIEGHMPVHGYAEDFSRDADASVNSAQNDPITLRRIALTAIGKLAETSPGDALQTVCDAGVSITSEDEKDVEADGFDSSGDQRPSVS